MSETSRRYSGELFFANVNRFTLLGRTGWDDPNREATQGVARSRSVLMGLFDPHAVWRTTSWEHAKSSRTRRMVFPKRSDAGSPSTPSSPLPPRSARLH